MPKILTPFSGETIIRGNHMGPPYGGPMLEGGKRWVVFVKCYTKNGGQYYKEDICR